MGRTSNSRDLRTEAYIQNQDKWRLCRYDAYVSWSSPDGGTSRTTDDVMTSFG